MICSVSSSYKNNIIDMTALGGNAILDIHNILDLPDAILCHLTTLLDPIWSVLWRHSSKELIGYSHVVEVEVECGARRHVAEGGATTLNWLGPQCPLRWAIAFAVSAAAYTPVPTFLVIFNQVENVFRDYNYNRFCDESSREPVAACDSPVEALQADGWSVEDLEVRCLRSSIRTSNWSVVLHLQHRSNLSWREICRHIMSVSIAPTVKKVATDMLVENTSSIMQVHELF